MAMTLKDLTTQAADHVFKRNLLTWLRQIFDPDDDTVSSPYVDNIRDSAGAVTLQVKEVDIGDWDMDATGTVTVAHGLTMSKIIAVLGYVRDDADTARDPFGTAGIGGTGAMGVNVNTAIDATNVGLYRLVGSKFDAVAYNATSYNRGHILILHTP